MTRSVELSRNFDPGLGPLALVFPCGMEFVITLFGALYAGFTVTALAPPRPGVTQTRFAAILGDCRPAAVLCPQAWVVRLEAAIAEADERAPVVAVEALAAGQARAVCVEPPVTMNGSRPAILQYTSGSTRAPRAVMLSTANIVANADLANSTWGLNEAGVFLNWLPHFHDMGLMGILYPLLAGGRVLLLDPLHMIQRPERWLRLIGEHGVTMSGGPAFAFAHCLQHVTEEHCEGLDLSSWSSAFCGAEPVPAALMAAFRARFQPHGLNPDAVFGSYGLAEYCLMVAGGNPTPDAERPSPPSGCEGIEPCRVAPEMQDNLRLVDPDTRQVAAAGEAGEIWLRGASTTGGYRNRPEETEATYGAVLADDEATGPWLRTGDIAVQRGDWLYVTGRLTDMLFVNGRKIPATDVEWLAGEQDAGLNPMAAAALMPDDLMTGKAVLLIELQRRARIADEPLAGERIRRAVAGAWGIELTDIRFLPSGSLPRTSSGKIRRREVADAWRKDRLEHALQ